MTEIKSKRQVTKNTIMLYVRMFVTMGIGLYSSRVVLNTLGVSDYGIYNVVGTIVPVFAFLSNSMASSISRFITFELGKDDTERSCRTFGSSLLIQLIIGIIILCLSEVIGIWAIHEKLIIPSDRLYAANWIFQFSVISILLNVIQIPYYACIIAHEKMYIYADIEILNAILKLLILYFLINVNFDKLILLSLLSTIVSIIVTSFYIIFSVRNFKECRSKIVIDKSILKPMITFSGFDLYGNMCIAIKSQGIPFIINSFLGVIVNAAVGVVYTVTNVFRSFCANILTVFRPQVVKSFAQEDYEQMIYMINFSVRMLLILSNLIVMIFIYNSHIILQLWLIKIPPLTSTLLNIALIENLFALLTDSLRTGINATGKIKGYSFWNGTATVLVIPFSYIALHLHCTSQIVFIISLASQIVCTTISLYYLKKEVPQYSVLFFLKILAKIIFPVIVVILFLHFVDIRIFDGMRKILVSIIVISFVYLACVYFTLESKEKKIIEGLFIKR